MKTKNVILGAVYEVRVSGQLVPVRVVRRFEASAYRYARSGPGTWERRTYFSVVNLATGRSIRLRASRLRRALEGYRCGHSACSQHFIDTGDTRCIEGVRS